MIIECRLTASDWIQLATAVGTVLLAIAAFYTLRQNKKQLQVLQKQQLEDRRARLSFEIIAVDFFYCLKISNVGQEPAYNVHLKFSGPFFDEHFSTGVKNYFAGYKDKTFCFVPGRDTYIYLCPTRSNANSTHIIHGHPFSSNQINTWIDEHKLSSIKIEGFYCDKYAILENLTIELFTSDGFLRYEDSSTRALQQISKAISCQNDMHRPIQEIIDHISKSIDIIQKNTSNTNV